MEPTYRVNEIFYSLQGEGAYTGVPMIFVRFSGCNLRCPFCDTRHESHTLMTASQIRSELQLYPCRTVCLTGGEPTLQVSEELLASAFEGYEIHMETNGSRPIPRGVHWATVSPKEAPVVVESCQELKLLHGQGSDDPARWEHLPAQVYCLQPIAVEGDEQQSLKNVEATIEYCKAHPLWRLSLQTHKVTHIR